MALMDNEYHSHLKNYQTVKSAWYTLDNIYIYISVFDLKLSLWNAGLSRMKSSVTLTFSNHLYHQKCNLLYIEQRAA